jgi:hypothetical protein
MSIDQRVEAEAGLVRCLASSLTLAKISSEFASSMVHYVCCINARLWRRAYSPRREPPVPAATFNR